jgi:hypothetical protein
MRRWLVLAWLAVAAAPGIASAEDAQPLEPRQGGYAFEQPRVLIQQRLLGLAHGVSMLVSACMDRPERVEAALAAYVPWREGQQDAIALAEADLARHYFGARAAEARWPDLVRALNLRNRLELAPESAELAAACATLPQALRQPRYDLNRQFRLLGLLAEATAGVEADLRRGWCREHLAGDERTLLDARFVVWQEINAPRLQRAIAALEADWPADAPAASLPEWQQMLRRDGRLRGSAEDCAAFSEGLKRPQAALRNVFAPPPESSR